MFDHLVFDDEKPQYEKIEFMAVEIISGVLSCQSALGYCSRMTVMRTSICRTMRTAR